MIRRPLIVLLVLGLLGCHRPDRHDAPTDGAVVADNLAPALRMQIVDAIAVPPAGWKAEPVKQSPRHTHQIWLSPSGHTAYGIIRFSLPLPVGPSLVLPFFLRAMARDTGQADLLEKADDPNLPGLRFVAEGGLYRVHTNLMVHGLEGWAVYAGTLRGEPVAPAELEIAEIAREHTICGLP